jgi:hypothetical protein
VSNSSNPESAIISMTFTSTDSENAGALLPAAPAPRALTAADFHQLADVPPALT